MIHESMACGPRVCINDSDAISSRLNRDTQSRELLFIVPPLRDRRIVDRAAHLRCAGGGARLRILVEHFCRYSVSTFCRYLVCPLLVNPTIDVLESAGASP